MKKNLLFGCLAAIVLLMTLPAVSAAESTVVQSHRTSSYLLTIQDIDTDSIRAKYMENPTPQTFIILTLAILFLKLLRMSILLPILVLLIYLRLISP
jgi:hypothetical protein